MSDCVFCKIVSGVIPAKIAYEDDLTFAFHDIQPVAPHHILIVPKRHLADVNGATEEFARELGALFVSAARIADQLGVANSGYRLIVNTGRDAGQIVPHLHVHFLAGQPMGWTPL